jgi:hypothetical protein
LPSRNTGEPAEDEELISEEELALEALDRKDFAVDEILQESYFDLDQIVDFLVELRKFEPKHDDKLRALNNDSQERRYSPPEFASATKTPVYGDPDMAGLHVAHRAAKRFTPPVVQAPHATELQLQQEVGELPSRARAALRVLQLLPTPRDDQNQPRCRVWPDGSRLEHAELLGAAY